MKILKMLIPVYGLFSKDIEKYNSAGLGCYHAGILFIIIIYLLDLIF